MPRQKLKRRAIYGVIEYSGVPQSFGRRCRTLMCDYGRQHGTFRIMAGYCTVRYLKILKYLMSVNKPMAHS